MNNIIETITKMAETQKQTLEYKLIVNHSREMCGNVIANPPSWWYYLIPGRVKEYRAYQDYCRLLLKMGLEDEHGI